MAAAAKQIFSPSTYQDLFNLWSQYPGAIPYAGGTGITRNQEKNSINILSLDKINELKRITRTERYLEIGAMVRLSEIINLGKIVPAILNKTLEGIASLQIRNMATIGGNLCERLDACAPMAALEAHLELRSSGSTRWISGSRFYDSSSFHMGPNELLTRIRIPLDQWNYSLYRKFKSPLIDESEGVMIFILKNQKSILTDLKIVYSGSILLHNRQSESALIGKRLPLDRKDALNFHESWNNYLETLKDVEKANWKNENKELLKAQILNFIDDAFLGISD